MLSSDYEDDDIEIIGSNAKSMESDVKTVQKPPTNTEKLQQEYNKFDRIMKTAHNIKPQKNPGLEKQRRIEISDFSIPAPLQPEFTITPNGTLE